jgi:hypothetical protein
MKELHQSGCVKKVLIQVTLEMSGSVKFKEKKLHISTKL